MLEGFRANILIVLLLLDSWTVQIVIDCLLFSLVSLLSPDWEYSSMASLINLREVSCSLMRLWLGRWLPSEECLVLSQSTSKVEARNSYNDHTSLFQIHVREGSQAKNPTRSASWPDKLIKNFKWFIDLLQFLIDTRLAFKTYLEPWK